MAHAGRYRMSALELPCFDLASEQQLRNHFSVDVG